MHSQEVAVMWVAWSHCLNHSTQGTTWGKNQPFGKSSIANLYVRDLGKMLAKANLPRASSHGNMFVYDTASMTGAGSLTSPLSPGHFRPDLSLSSQPSSFSKSDVCLERPPPPQTLTSLLTNSQSPSRQVRDWHYNKVFNWIWGMDLSGNGLIEECPIKYFASSIVFVYSQIRLGKG